MDFLGTAVSRYTISGFPVPSTTSLVMVQIPTVLSEGISYIRSIITDSMMERRPLAPVFRSTARSAIFSMASAVNSSFTSSSSNSLWYCLVRAFFGSVRMRTRDARSRRFKETVMGTRPMNSGISPNFTRSSGSTCFKSWSMSRVLLSAMSALNPMELVEILRSTIFSRPSKAPPQMNRMLVVSICRSSWWGCFLPPWGGTLATVPSRIFNRACCTPSPDTSRVMDTFSDFLVILSISSI